jgi:hypothetical protein
MRDNELTRAFGARFYQAARIAAKVRKAHRARTFEEVEAAAQAFNAAVLAKVDWDIKNQQLNIEISDEDVV